MDHLLVVDTCQGTYISWFDEYHRRAKKIGRKLAGILARMTVSTIYPCEVGNYNKVVEGDACTCDESTLVVAKNLNEQNPVDVLVVSESMWGDAREYDVIEELVKEIPGACAICLAPHEKYNPNTYQKHRENGMRVILNDHYNELAKVIESALSKKAKTPH